MQAGLPPDQESHEQQGKNQGIRAGEDTEFAAQLAGRFHVLGTDQGRQPLLGGGGACNPPFETGADVRLDLLAALTIQVLHFTDHLGKEPRKLLGKQKPDLSDFVPVVPGKSPGMPHQETGVDGLNLLLNLLFHLVPDDASGDLLNKAGIGDRHGEGKGEEQAADDAKDKGNSAGQGHDYHSLRKC